MDDLLYKIGITRIPLVGAVNARQLISYCGSPQSVFETPKRLLLRIPGIGPQTAANILRKEALEEAERELHFITDNDIKALFYLDADYPYRLKPYADSPVLLYYHGQADLNAERVVAIVGTRRPSPAGSATCEELIEGLQTYDVVVISGLAYGIDAVAHRRCTDLHLPTVGVLGHGLKLIYPPEHRQLARQMLATGGGLLTEYPSETGPEREHFPMRNRIIAGLCDALVVVETARRGGSMISAELANSYNKDVFAVPGRPRDLLSEGCNLLIKSHKAALIDTAADIAYHMQWDAPRPRNGAQASLFVELTEEEKLVVHLLGQAEAVHIDQLTFAANMSNSAMASVLLQLECKGLIKLLPGKCYTLLAR